jgi:hypothetical protein
MTKPKNSVDFRGLPFDLALNGVAAVTGLIIALNGSLRLILAGYLYEPDKTDGTVLALFMLGAGVALSGLAAWRLGRLLGSTLFVLLSLTGHLAGLGEPTSATIHTHDDDDKEPTG